jgi:hypothetical protein
MRCPSCGQENLPNERRCTRCGAALPASGQAADKEFVRAENEDDDGYDPFSDRPPAPEPLFEQDPWD